MTYLSNKMARPDIQQVKQRFGIIGNSPLLDRALEVALRRGHGQGEILVVQLRPVVAHGNHARQHGVGIELDRPCGELVQRGLEAGILINVTAEKVVRLLPALNFSAEEGQELVARLVPLIRNFLSA